MYIVRESKRADESLYLKNLFNFKKAVRNQTNGPRSYQKIQYSLDYISMNHTNPQQKVQKLLNFLHRSQFFLQTYFEGPTHQKIL